MDVGEMKADVDMGNAEGLVNEVMGVVRLRGVCLCVWSSV